MFDQEYNIGQYGYCYMKNLKIPDGKSEAVNMEKGKITQWPKEKGQYNNNNCHDYMHRISFF